MPQNENLAERGKPDVAIGGVAAALPDARIAVLDGQGHTADVLAPELVAKRLLAFLGEPR